MIELAIARSDLLDEATFRLLRARVPAERRRKGDRYHRLKDRYASVVSFSLLQHLWRTGGGGPMPEIVLGRRGKPAFAPPRARHFNWSHDAWVCVCATAPAPVGVDVQSRVPYDEGLFERMAAPSERVLRDRLLRSDDLSALWTRKEAVVKRTGWGLSTPLRHVDTLAARDVLTFSCAEPDFRMSLTVEGLDEQDLLAALRVRFVQPGPAPGEWTDAPGPAPLHRLPRSLAAPAAALLGAA
ncbi:MAG TPA: 4'-phosphopantetheinyl transferase superfamily protein [Glycomyces sp.]|nr:4'-phosphopantetheinyl transferase superfamily protein [Glycomyces sp.]